MHPLEKCVERADADTVLELLVTRFTENEIIRFTRVTLSCVQN
jgi:hypothetical protein